MLKCKIQWIDGAGNPTPDDNDAIGYTWREAYVEQHGGHAHQFPETDRIPICAEHAKRLGEPGMVHWSFQGLPEEIPESMVDEPTEQHEIPEVDDLLDSMSEDLDNARSQVTALLEDNARLKQDLRFVGTVLKLAKEVVQATDAHFKALPEAIARVLDAHQSFCLDNETERAHLLSELVNVTLYGEADAKENG